MGKTRDLFKKIRDTKRTFQRRQWHPTPVLLPGKSHVRRSLVRCSPWGRWELDTTQWLHFQFSLSCIGKGNGNPLACSCLQNPRDGRAWWAAVYGVAQSWTLLKRLSSSSSSKRTFHAKMSLIKDRNGLDLTETDDIKKRWQEYTADLYEKDLHDPDNHDGVITYLWSSKAGGCITDSTVRSKWGGNWDSFCFFLGLSLTLCPVPQKRL